MTPVVLAALGSIGIVAATLTAGGVWYDLAVILGRRRDR